MSELTVIRTLTSPRVHVWHVLTQARHFERWMPAKEGTADLDVRTGGSWQATVISSNGDETPLTGRYLDVHEPERMVMEVPGGVVAKITLVAALDLTEIVYIFDASEELHGVIEQSVDEVLGRVSKILADLGWPT